MAQLWNTFVLYVAGAGGGYKRIILKWLSLLGRRQLKCVHLFYSISVYWPLARWIPWNGIKGKRYEFNHNTILNTSNISKRLGTANRAYEQRKREYWKAIYPRPGLMYTPELFWHNRFWQTYTPHHRAWPTNETFCSNYNHLFTPVLVRFQLQTRAGFQVYLHVHLRLQ